MGQKNKKRSRRHHTHSRRSKRSGKNKNTIINRIFRGRYRSGRSFGVGAHPRRTNFTGSRIIDKLRRNMFSIYKRVFPEIYQKAIFLQRYKIPRIIYNKHNFENNDDDDASNSEIQINNITAAEAQECQGQNQGQGQCQDFEYLDGICQMVNELEQSEKMMALKSKAAFRKSRQAFLKLIRKRPRLPVFFIKDYLENDDLDILRVTIDEDTSWLDL